MSQPIVCSGKGIAQHRSDYGQSGGISQELRCVQSNESASCTTERLRLIQF